MWAHPFHLPSAQGAVCVLLGVCGGGQSGSSLSRRVLCSWSSSKRLGVQEPVEGRCEKGGSFLGTLLSSCSGVTATGPGGLEEPLPLPASVSRWVTGGRCVPTRELGKAGGGRARVGAGPPTAAGRDLPGPRRRRAGLLPRGEGRGAGSCRPRSCSLSTCRGQTARAGAAWPCAPTPAAAAAREAEPEPNPSRDAG